MNSQNNQATKKGLILLSGVIIGILTGFFVAFTLLQKFDPHTRPVAKEEQPRDIEGKTADTVVKYVVYRYESEPGVPSRTSQPDSLETDSTLVELYGADLFLEDEVLDRVGTHHDLGSEDTSCAILDRQELLGDYATDVGSELLADDRLLVRRGTVDDTVDGLAGTCGVECGENEVTCLSSCDSSGDRLEVTHLTNEDDIRVFTE